MSSLCVLKTSVFWTTKPGLRVQLLHGSCKAWPLRSGPPSGWHHAAAATILTGRSSLRCCAEEPRWHRASCPYGRAICCQRVFQESSEWVVHWSREGATKAASGNCCVQSGSVWVAGLHLWREAWGICRSCSWTPTTGRSIQPAKVRHKCLPRSHLLLAGTIGAGVCASLDGSGSAALQVLQEAHGLHSLRAACEEKVAEDFETCSQHPDFGKISVSQLGRILKREDLGVSREEVVLQGIFTWLKVSNDREAFLGLLMQHVHFQALSMENLLGLGRATLVLMVMTSTEKLMLWSPEREPAVQVGFRRRGVVEKHWSPFLGATNTVALQGEKCFPYPVSIYAATKVRLLLQNLAAVASSVGSVVTLRLKCGVPMCLEFMTSDLVVWPSPQVGRFSWQI